MGPSATLLCRCLVLVLTASAASAASLVSWDLDTIFGLLTMEWSETIFVKSMNTSAIELMSNRCALVVPCFLGDGLRSGAGLTHGLERKCGCQEIYTTWIIIRRRYAHPSTSAAHATARQNDHTFEQLSAFLLTDAYNSPGVLGLHRA